MLDFVKEESIWQNLKRETRPIILYGMGDGALKVMASCQKHGISISGIFASDAYVRGHSFAGFPVKKLCEIEEEFDDFVILLCFAVFTSEWLQKIDAIHEKHPVFAPDVPVFGEGLFDGDYVRQHEKELQTVHDLLADERSKKVFEQVLNFKLSGKIDYLKLAQTPKEEVYQSIFHFDENEHFLDLGGYDGDTVLEFLQQTGGKYESVTVFEPDAKNFKKLQNTAKRNQWNRMDLRNEGVWSTDGVLNFDNRAGRNSALCETGKISVSVRSIDSLMQNRPCTYIKMDVEGAEYEALDGGRKTLAEQHPKLAFSGYHRNEDLFVLPLLLHEIAGDYGIYLRHHPYLPAWETNFYAV